MQQYMYNECITNKQVIMTIIEIKPGYYKASLKRADGSTDLFGTDRTHLIMSLIEEVFA